jgi:hypothetical protein
MEDEIANLIGYWDWENKTANQCASAVLSLIDSQRCVWTKNAKITAFRTSCGKAHGLNWNFNYNPMCPGCGHQIEVKDGQG